MGERRKTRKEQNREYIESLKQLLGQPAPIPPFLSIEESPVAGMGVFTKKVLTPGLLLGHYQGVVVDAEVYYASDAIPTEYALDVGHGLLVDASDPARGGWGRYINCARGTGRRPNVEFRKGGTIVAVRRIAPGEELLVDYGREYKYDF